MFDLCVMVPAIVVQMIRLVPCEENRSRTWVVGVACMKGHQI